MNDEQMENHRGTDRVPRLERALRESWNKSFQLFHAAARSDFQGRDRRGDQKIGSFDPDPEIRHY